MEKKMNYLLNEYACTEEELNTMLFLTSKDESIDIDLYLAIYVVVSQMVLETTGRMYFFMKKVFEGNTNNEPIEQSIKRIISYGSKPKVEVLSMVYGKYNLSFSMIMANNFEEILKLKHELSELNE